MQADILYAQGYYDGISAAQINFDLAPDTFYAMGYSDGMWDLKEMKESTDLLHGQIYNKCREAWRTLKKLQDRVSYPETP